MSFPSLRYFASHEFASPDTPGSGDSMSPEFVTKLDELRSRCGFPFVINSGYRTEAHNRRVGGVDSSAHTEGHAADIRIRDSWQRFTIVSEALKMGFTRIGIGGTFVHVDDSPTLPGKVIWKY